MNEAFWELLHNADNKEIARLTAKAERLRGALYEFATQHKCGCGHPHCNNCERDRMAEAALAQGSDAMGEINDPVIVSRITLQTLFEAALFQHRELTNRDDPADPYRYLLTIETLCMAIQESHKALRIKAGLYHPDTTRVMP